jgi:uridylate kinase
MPAAGHGGRRIEKAGLCVLACSANVQTVGKRSLPMPARTESIAAPHATCRLGLEGSVMNSEQLQRELRFQLTMSVARRMLSQSLISEAEYRDFEREMAGKYVPVIGGLSVKSA